MALRCNTSTEMMSYNRMSLTIRAPMQLYSEVETAKPASRIARTVYGEVSGHIISAILILIPFALTVLVAVLLRNEHYYELSLINAPKTLATASYILAAIAGGLAIYGLRASMRPLSPMSQSVLFCYFFATAVCLIFPEVFHVTTEAIFLRSSQVFPLP
jgi:hypothetical protein